MRERGRWICPVVAVWVLMPMAWAQEAKTNKTDMSMAGETQAATPAMPQPATPNIPEKDAKEAEATARLHGTRWVIELIPMSGEKPKRPLKDTLTFDKGKISSEAHDTDGYPSSNYTLTVGDDGIPVWETMQTAEHQGIVFWRGELHGEKTSGILSKHPLEGETRDYSFVGFPLKGAAQAAASSASAKPGDGPTGQDHASRVEATKPKKGWFGR